MNKNIPLVLLLIMCNIFTMQQEVVIKSTAQKLAEGLSCKTLLHLSPVRSDELSLKEQSRWPLTQQMVWLAMRNSAYKKHASGDHLEALLRIASLPQPLQKHILEYVYGVELEDNMLAKHTVAELLNGISYADERNAFSGQIFKIKNPHFVGNYTGFLGSCIGRYPRDSYYAKVDCFFISIARKECIKLTIDALRLLEKIISRNEPNAELYKIKEADIPLIKQLKSIQYEEKDNLLEDVDPLTPAGKILFEELDTLKAQSELVTAISSFLRVGIEYNPSSIRDSGLLAVPIVINSLVPDMIVHLGNTLVEGLLPEASLLRVGVKAAGVPVLIFSSFIGSYLVSMIVFPFCDNKSSGVVQLQQFFGRNCHQKYWSATHVLTNLLHLGCAISGKLLFMQQALFWKFIGGSIYLFRLFAAKLTFQLMRGWYQNPIVRGAAYKDASQKMRQSGPYIYLLSDVVTE